MALIRAGFPRDGEYFFIENEEFANLEIRDGGGGGSFHYFYDTARSRLIKSFVLRDQAQTAIHCDVTLIKKDDEGFTPRLRFWIRDKTKPGRETIELEIPDLPENRPVKASVDTGKGHESFWQLIDFLRSFSGITVPGGKFTVVDARNATLAKILNDENKDSVLPIIAGALGSSLTEKDIALLTNRKERIERFRRLLYDQQYYTEELERTGYSEEKLWQVFFEENNWVFGYGLNLVACEGMDDGKLERFTRGSDIFGGAGYRPDAVMRTKGFISSLLICEIKTPGTPLLASEPYRKPATYAPDPKLSGAVSQVQKTTRKVVRSLSEQLKTMYAPSGDPTGVEIGTTRPRQVVITGHLSQFNTPHGINAEMVESFELFRTATSDTDIITFDELFERAKFIVHDGKSAAGDDS